MIKSRVVPWLAGMVVLVAVGLRLPTLAQLPLWTDELFTRFYPQLGLDYLWGAGFRAEPTPPLYYTVIWVVERLGGSGAVALRLPSAAGSLLGIGLTAALGRELFGRWGPGLLGALLLSLAPVNVFYAQEARAYALQGAALALALLGLARVLRGGSGLVAYGIGAAVAMWLHPTSVLAVVAMNAVAAIVIAVDPALGVRDWWRWALANVAVAAVCLPLAPGLLAPPNGGAATDWIPALSRTSLESVIGETLAGPALIRHSQGIAEAAALGLAALFVLTRWRPGWRAAAVLLLVPGTTLLLMVAVSLVKPVLLGRTLAWLLIPLAVALGHVLFRRPVLAMAAVSLVGAALVVQIARGPTLKEDWPGLFARMGTSLDGEPPALLVLAPHSPPAAVAVYGPAGAAPVRLDDGAKPVPETAIIPPLFGTPTITMPEIAAAVAAGRPVWLVYRRPEYEWVRAAIAGLPPPRRAVQSEDGSNPALRALYW